ncbi:hypothetical protein EMIT0P228_250001 [Pseudomonas brassicacearum]
MVTGGPLSRASSLPQWDGGGLVVLDVDDIAPVTLTSDTLRPHVAGDDMRTKRVVEMAFWRHDR